MRLLILILLVSGSVFAGDAWFLGAKFDAKDTEVLGIPVEKIDPSFKKASLLNQQDIIKKFPIAKNDLAKNGASFSIDLSLEGKKYRVVNGVYQGENSRGIFILVVEKSKSKWKKVFLKRYAGEAGFSALFQTGTSILFNSCLNCGHSGSLTWDKAKGFIYEEPKEDD